MLDVQEIINQRVCKNPSCTNFTKRTYCSRKCANEVLCKDPERNKRIGETTRKKGKKTGIIRICETCGRSFYVYAFRKNSNRFCSMKCTRRQVTLSCANCGKEFNVDPCRKDSAKFCSVKCKDLMPVSEEQKMKISLNAKTNPNFGTKGKTFSEATKLKMSENHKGGALKGSKKLPITGLKISMSKYGKFHTLETRLKIKENAKVNSNFGMSGKKHSEETKLKMRNSRLLIMKSQEILLKDIRSKPEVAWGQKIENIFHVKLEHSKWVCRRCFDFCYKNFLFEIDGCYWHSLPKQVVVDQEKNKIAQDFNFSLIRFPLNQKNDIDKIIFENYPILYSIFTSGRLLTC